MDQQIFNIMLQMYWVVYSYFVYCFLCHSLDLARMYVEWLVCDNTESEKRNKKLNILLDTFIDDINSESDPDFTEPTQQTDEEYKDDEEEDDEDDEDESSEEESSSTSVSENELSDNNHYVPKN